MKLSTLKGKIAKVVGIFSVLSIVTKYYVRNVRCICVLFSMAISVELLAQRAIMP